MAPAITPPSASRRGSRRLLTLLAAATFAAFVACGGDQFSPVASGVAGAGQAGQSGSGASRAGSAGIAGASAAGAGGIAGAPGGGGAGTVQGGAAGAPPGGAAGMAQSGAAGAVQGGEAGSSNGATAGSAGATAGSAGAAAGSAGGAGKSGGGGAGAAGAPTGGAAGSGPVCASGQPCAAPGAWGPCMQGLPTSCVGSQSRSIALCVAGACEASKESRECDLPANTSCGEPRCCGPGMPDLPVCGGRCGSVFFEKVCNGSGGCKERCDHIACWSDGCGAGTATKAACPLSE